MSSEIRIERFENVEAISSVAGQQLMDMIAAGCREEERYLPGNAIALEWACRDLQRDLFSGTGAWWVAWCASCPIGLIRLGVAGGETLDEGVLTGLYVEQGWRHQGVGRQLVEVALLAAHAQGWRRVFVHVAEKNPAVSFYSRLGLFRIVDSTLPGYMKLEWSSEDDSSNGEEDCSVSNRKSIPFMLRAAAVGLGLGGVVLGMVSPERVERIALVLGIGLVCLAISTLND